MKAEDLTNEELANVFLIAAPKQNLPGKEVNDGHRQHIADGTDDQCGEIIQTVDHRVGHTGPQLDQRNHGHQKCDQIFFQHLNLHNSKLRHTKTYYHIFYPFAMEKP